MSEVRIINGNELSINESASLINISDALNEYSGTDIKIKYINEKAFMRTDSCVVHWTKGMRTQKFINGTRINSTVYSDLITNKTYNYFNLNTYNTMKRKVAR